MGPATATLQGAFAGLDALEDRYVPVRLGEEEGGLKTAAGIAYRYLRLTLLDFPVAGIHALLRHEVAGHGGRIRQIGGDVVGYDIQLPPPYGDGGGATHFELDDPAWYEEVATVAGGLESAYLDAAGLEESWTAVGRMGFQQAIQYLLDVSEVVGYINDFDPGRSRPGHDIDTYRGLVGVAARDAGLEGGVSADDLKTASRIELLNPAWYYALYTVLWRFLVKGSSAGPVPAFGVGSWRVMPTGHLVLAPFGHQYVLGLSAAGEDRLLEAIVRFGDGPWGGFQGIGVTAGGVRASPRWTLRGRVEVWRQFELEAEATRRSNGAMGLVEGRATLDDLPLAAVVQVGAKTGGYLPGEALAGGAVLRVGVAYRF